MVTPIESSRLLFKGWDEDCFPEFASYFSDPEMSRYVGGLKTQEEAWRLLAAYIGHWHLKGYGYWAVYEKHTQKLVGAVGLWKSIGWPELELGYWLLKEMQGQGYAIEAAERCLTYAFQTMKVPTVVSYIDPENLPSRKLAERLGGILEETIDLLDFGPHCVYRYQSKQYL